MSWGDDVYSNPKKHGLTTVAEMSWDNESYQFDITVCWRDAEGNLYWSDDTGCSCPSPFEDVKNKDELETGTLQHLISDVQDRQRRAEEYDAEYIGDDEYFRGLKAKQKEYRGRQIADFIETVRSYG